MIPRPPGSTRTEHTLSLHDALPISGKSRTPGRGRSPDRRTARPPPGDGCCPHRTRTKSIRSLHLHGLPRRAGKITEQCIGQTADLVGGRGVAFRRSEEHTSELQSLMRISYAVFCLKKKT